MKTLLILLLFATEAIGQDVHNFDQAMSRDTSQVVIQPPPGVTWKLTSGAFIAIRPDQSHWITIPATPGTDERPRRVDQFDTLSVSIYKQNDRAEESCSYCDYLIRVGLGANPWVPIVGGYASDEYWGNLRGQDRSITLTYPQRLVIQVHGLTASFGVFQALVRFSIRESSDGGQ